MQHVHCVDLQRTMIRAVIVQFVPPQALEPAAFVPGGTRKPRQIDLAELMEARLSAVLDPAHNGELHSRSPGDRRLCAARARAVAVDAAYRFTISRLRHPVSRIRSPSAPPSASHWWANVCRN